MKNSIQLGVLFASISISLVVNGCSGADDGGTDPTEGSDPTQQDIGKGDSPDETGGGGGSGWFGCKEGSSSTWSSYDSDKEKCGEEAQQNAVDACEAADGWWNRCVAQEPFYEPGYVTGWTCKAKACRPSK
jgi:hypothetical protein